METKVKKKYPYFKTLLIIIGAIWVGLFCFGIIWVLVGNFNSTTPTENSSQGKWANENVNIVNKITQDYHQTHTYSSIDFFVCSDMAIDVWNLVKTKGINAEICAGNINENISSIFTTSTENDSETWNKFSSWLGKINHAWVMAEAEPFTFIALETTGGYLVWGENVNETNLQKNDLYYHGLCFNTPAEFKSFIEVRTNLLQTCKDAIDMENYWNTNYVGKYLTNDISEYKGRMEQKTEECASLINEMKGLMT